MLILFRIAFGASIVIALVGGAALGSPPAATTEFGTVQSRMELAVADHTVPSLSVAAIRDGRIVWMHSSGWADIENRRPATPSTVYRIGSVSKSITDTVAAIASRHGDINLASPVTDYLPWLGNRSEGHFRSATLTALINMNAGMIQAVHYPGLKHDDIGPGQTRFDQGYALAPMSPGPRFAYSNMGPQLVARAIAAATHRSFGAYMRRVLLDPLEMNDTFVDSASVSARLLARSYRPTLKPFEESYETDPVSGAGYLTSLNDLAKFALFHLTGRTGHGAGPLGPTELAALHSPLPGAFYSFGWGKIGTGDFTVLISDGQVNGGQATILLAPHLGLGVVVMTNTANDIVNQIALAAMETMASGLSASFERASGTMESGLASSVVSFYPPDGSWSAAGSLALNGNLRQLDAVVEDAAITLRLDGAPSVSGTPLPREDGFAKWKIPCLKVLPACIDETRADATLSLTRDANGYAGMIAVESSLGLFPYEVHLGQRKSPSPTRE